MEGVDTLMIPEDAFVFDDFGQFDVRCFDLEEDEVVSIFTVPVDESTLSDTVLVLLNEAWGIVEFNDDSEESFLAGVFDFVRALQMVDMMSWWLGMTLNKLVR